MRQAKLEERIVACTAQRDQAAADIDRAKVRKHQQALDELHVELETNSGGLAMLQQQVKETLEAEGVEAAKARGEIIVAEAQGTAESSNAIPAPSKSLPLCKLKFARFDQVLSTQGMAASLLRES